MNHTTPFSEVALQMQSTLATHTTKVARLCEVSLDQIVGGVSDGSEARRFRDGIVRRPDGNARLY
jgi:hypothetical protein